MGGRIMSSLSKQVEQLEFKYKLSEGKVRELQEMVSDLEDDLENECSYNYNEENSMLLTKSMNFSWHLECLGYDDMTIDKIANGFHREDKL